MASEPQRLLRFSISVYRSPYKTGPEAREFATNNYAVKAAGIIAKHGVETYVQCFCPPNLREALEEINQRRNRGWVVDNHDLTAEFYFRSFAELKKVTSDPEFQALQVQEEPFINRENTVVSLGWVERYVDNGKVVNVKNGKSTYREYPDLSSVLSF